MKALSIHQPWAWAILHAGKTVENRTWPTRHRGPLLVHASKSRASYDRESRADWREAYGVALPPWDELPVGAVVGVVDVIDCVPADPGLPFFLPGHGPNVWVEGPWCWVLADPRPLREPVPMRGMQGVFDVPEALLTNLIR